MRDLRKQTGSSAMETSNYLQDLKAGQTDSSGNKPLNTIASANATVVAIVRIKTRKGIGIFGCRGYHRHVTTKILKIKQTQERKRKGNCDQKRTIGHVD